MRVVLFCVTVLLVACGPRLTFHSSQLTPDQRVDQASHIFVGVIEEHSFDVWPRFRFQVPESDQSHYWKVLRRTVRVENVLRGVESRKTVDMYEIVWTGATTGDWNATQDGERDLFLVRVEDARYHLVADWVRNIFPVVTGPHKRLPMDDSNEDSSNEDWCFEMSEPRGSIWLWPDARQQVMALNSRPPRPA